MGETLSRKREMALADIRAQRKAYRESRHGVPQPPAPKAKELWARGTIPPSGPLAEALLTMSRRCRCVHVSGAHRLGGLGPCEAKKCPCERYEQSPEYALPVWKSEAEAVVVPAETV